MAEVGGSPSCLSARMWATERWQSNGATHSVAHYGAPIFFLPISRGPREPTAHLPLATIPQPLVGLRIPLRFCRAIYPSVASLY